MNSTMIETRDTLDECADYVHGVALILMLLAEQEDELKCDLYAMLENNLFLVYDKLVLLNKSISGDATI